MKKKCKVFLVMAFCTAFILAGCSGSKSDYESATGMMESGDYAGALEVLSEIEDYEDAADLILKCKYELGCSAMNEEDWDNAISYFEDLDYEDSADLLETCITEKGMHENADYDFLEDLEAAVTKRLEQADAGEDHSTIVNTELGRIEDYEEATFYDSRLEELAKQYISGLQLQKSSLSEDAYSDQQIDWQQGLVQRYETLIALHDEYDFFEDDDEFNDLYTSQLETQQELLNMYLAFEEDIMEQWDGQSDVFSGGEDYTITGKYKNNTEYTLSFMLYITYFDDDGSTQVESTTAYIENLAPEDSVAVELYFPLDEYLQSDGTWTYSFDFDWEVF